MPGVPAHTNPIKRKETAMIETHNDVIREKHLP
jgi:hypothetical protein